MWPSKSARVHVLILPYHQISTIPTEGLVSASITACAVTLGIYSSCWWYTLDILYLKHILYKQKRSYTHTRAHTSPTNKLTSHSILYSSTAATTTRDGTMKTGKLWLHLETMMQCKHSRLINNSRTYNLLLMIFCYQTHIAAPTTNPSPYLWTESLHSLHAPH